MVIAFAEALKFRDEVIQEFTTQINDIATILEELQAKGVTNVDPYHMQVQYNGDKTGALPSKHCKYHITSTLLSLTARCLT